MLNQQLGAQQSQKYSIWIPIEEEEKSTTNLAELISTISQKYKTPLFRPHCTALGGLQHLDLPSILDITRTVANDFAPFYVCYGDVETGAMFYQSVFLKFRQISTLLLTNLHEALKHKAYNERDILYPGGANTIYMPHVSLVYGYLNDTIKGEILEQVKALNIGIGRDLFPKAPSHSSVVWSHDGHPEPFITLGSQIRLDDIEGSHNSKDVCSMDKIDSLQSNTSQLIMPGFRVNRLAVMDTDLSKDVSSWKVIEMIPLTGRDRASTDL